MSEGIRINQYLAKCGVASRREADRMITQGRVTIDGHTALLGDRIIGGEEVKLDNKPVNISEDRVVLAVNKPVDVVCTTAEFKGEKNIINLINYPARVFPVGRLDKASEGLIFLTNDGELSQHIAAASNMHEKEYEVTVNKDLTPDIISKLRGEMVINIEGTLYTTRPCKVKKTGARSFNIILTQGFNRQIRRMCETLGIKVLSLRRIRIMNVRLGDIPVGSYRVLDQEEIDKLCE